MTSLVSGLEGLCLNHEQPETSVAVNPGHTMVSSGLGSLPSELLCTIVTLLDPISLVSLAQTCRFLRDLIQPSDRELLERLLRLELVDEYGGPIPTFNTQGNPIRPFPDPIWDRIVYACSRCLKLKHHLDFDNHSIYKAKWRKPPLNSYEANKLTSWIYPHGLKDDAPLGVLRHRQRQSELEDIAAWLKRQSETEQLRTRNTHRSEAIEMQALEHNQAPASLHLVGRSRNLRLCNECRFQSGFYARPTSSNRSMLPSVPIVTSRQQPCRTSFGRYLPGLGRDLDSDDVPRKFKVYRDDPKEDFYTLYQVRCPHCCEWKELAQCLSYEGKTSKESRTGTWGASETSLGCNACLAKRQPDELVSAILRIGKRLAEADEEGAKHQLRFGWRLLEQEMRTSVVVRTAADATAQEGFVGLESRVLGGLPWLSASNYGRHQKTLQWDTCNLDVLRRRVQVFRDFCGTLHEEDWQAVMSNPWFRIWLEDYEKMEKAWELAKERAERFSESAHTDPAIRRDVLQWALNESSR